MQMSVWGERVMKQNPTMPPPPLFSIVLSLSILDCCINRGVKSYRYHEVKFRQFVSTQSKAVLWPIFGGPFGGLTIRFHIIYGGTVTYGLFITVRPQTPPWMLCSQHCCYCSLSPTRTHTHRHTVCIKLISQMAFLFPLCLDKLTSFYSRHSS